MEKAANYIQLDKNDCEKITNFEGYCSLCARPTQDLKGWVASVVVFKGDKDIHDIIRIIKEVGEKWFGKWCNTDGNEYVEPDKDRASFSTPYHCECYLVPLAKCVMDMRLHYGLWDNDIFVEVFRW